MLVYGFKVEASQSPKRAFYLAVATADGRVLARYGPQGGQGQIRVVKQFAAAMTTPITEQLARQAVESLRELWAQKTSGSGERHYDTMLIACTVVDLPNNGADIRVVVEEFERYAAHVGSSHTDFTPGAAEFVNAVTTGSVPAAAAAATPPLSARGTRLGPVATGPVTRTNGEVYHPRDLGGHPDVAALRKLREIGKKVRLSGPPGSGKTALIEAAYGEDVITVGGHGEMTVGHLVGMYQPTPDGGFRWVWGPLYRAMTQGRVLFLDEVTRIPREVLGCLYSVLDSRGVLIVDDRPDVDPVQAADGFYVCVAYNPDSGFGLDEALADRFPLPISVPSDFDTATALGVPAKFVRLARNLATKDREDRDNGGPGVWVPSLRLLLDARDLISACLGEQFAVSALVGACAYPESAAKVAETAEAVFGFAVTPLALGSQV